jgi:hypothetical protein
MTSCSSGLYMDAFKPTGMNSFILAMTCKLTELGLSNKHQGRQHGDGEQQVQEKHGPWPVQGNGAARP